MTDPPVTTLATTVLILHMLTLSSLADVARDADGARLDALGATSFIPGLVVLLAVQVVNVYKPPGMTRYGWRKQDEQRRQQGGHRAAPTA